MCILKKNNMAYTNKMKVYALVALLSFSCFTGCAVGPDFVRPEAPKVDRYTPEGDPAKTVVADGKAQQFEWGAKIAANWWRLFNSTKLETVIKEAFTNNQTLQSAQASLRRSQENLRAGYGVSTPR